MEEFRRLHQMVAPHLLWFENSGFKFILTRIELYRYEFYQTKIPG
jgi:hypothetical protein